MHKISEFVWAGVSLLTLAAPAFAQTGQIIDETPPPGTELPTSEPEGADVADDTGELAPSNEIVVSARRRAESVQDVPQTVNVVTAAQVEKLNLRNFTEIASVVPGLQLQSQGAFANNATVRGVAFNPQASGSNPSVEFYLNDAPISSAFLFQSTFDFGQFELQRGPQGTLRGRAAPSGQIAVTTRRPDLDEVGAVFNGTITDLHARKVDGAFNVPVISDVLAFRVAGVIDNHRADRVRSISEDINPQFSDRPFTRTKSIRGSVRFEPTDWAQFNFMYQNLHSVRHTYTQVVSESLINPTPQLPAGSSLIIAAQDRLGFEEQGDYNRQDQDVYIGNADFQFAGQRLSYVGSYNKQDNGILAPNVDNANFFASPRVVIAQRVPGDLANFDPVCQDEALSQGVILNTGNYNQCTHTFSTRKSHELRLASEERITGIFDYVVGMFYDKNTPSTNLSTETPLATAPAGQTAGVLAGTVNPAGVNVNRSGIIRRGGSTEKSVFGNVVAHLLEDRLELSGGLRYIDYKNNDFPTFSVTPVPSAAQLATGQVVPCPDFGTVTCFPLTGNAAEEVTKTNKTIYTASVKFKPTEDIMVYALTGTSFRPGPRVVGGFSARQSAREQRYRILPPETSTGYEIGAKASFLDGRGRFNIAAYHQKFRNYPFRGPSVFFISTNVTTGAEEAATFNFVSPVPVTVKGVEGELSFDILDRWSLGVNASYADGKIKNGTVACNQYFNAAGQPIAPTVAQIRAVVGPGETVAECAGLSQRANTTPKFSGNIQSEYGFDMTDNTDAFVRGLYSFFGKSINEPDNPLDDVGFYGLLNFYAGIRDKDGAWELTVFGKNITKEREILTVENSLRTTQVRVGASSANFSSPYRSVSVLAPREFGITAKIALGSR